MTARDIKVGNLVKIRGTLMVIERRRHQSSSGMMVVEEVFAGKRVWKSVRGMEEDSKGSVKLIGTSAG